MSARKIQAATAKSRSTAAVRVAPITRAVRLALAASATALALSASPAVLAGTCTVAGDSSIHCNGAFADTVYYGDVDLTLVLGDSAPTTVTPPPGNEGVFAYGSNSVSVTSDADITTDYAPGIVAIGGNSTSVTNTGSIKTSGGDTGAGIVAVSFNDGATTTVDNSGPIDVTAVGNAFGIYAYSLGATSVNNSGDINATAAYGLAEGIFATGTTVDVSNSGTITASSGYWAAGIDAKGDDLTSVDNTGSISAYGTGSYSHAFGIYAVSSAGSANVSNSGDITAIGSYSTGIDVATHASGGTIDIDNSGDITVGDANASYYGTGIHAASNYDGSDITVVNSGNIVANSYYGSTGIAIAATGVGSNVSVSNSGSIYANTTGKYGATGIVASADGSSTIDNSGVITVAHGGNAYGAMALAFNGTASVVNSGDITVEAADLVGNGYGIVASSQNGMANVDNTGNISVSMAGYGGYYGMGILATGTGGATVTNAGAISAQGIYAYGIEARAGNGDVLISNTEAGVVQAQSLFSSAIGLAGISTVGDVTIDNAGGVYALSAYGAIGVLARARNGNADANNSNYVLAYSVYGDAIGVLSRANFGDAGASNSGTITAYSQYGNATGVYGNGRDGASVTISNSGDITAIAGAAGTATAGNAYGVLAVGSSVDVANAGNINAYAYGEAVGVIAQGDSVTHVGNSGVIQAVGNDAIGVFAGSAYDAGSVAVDNSGDIAAYGSATATGIQAVNVGVGGSVSVNNSGGVHAFSDGGAVGVFARNDAGTATVSNSGDVSAMEGSISHGVLVSADQAAVANSGTVFAQATSDAYGVLAVGYAEAAVTNASTGDIGAQAYGYAVGVLAYSAMDAATVTNAGSIHASVEAGDGLATGVNALGYSATLVNNSGSITALAVAGSSAVGVRVGSGGDATVTNSGTIAASAVAGDQIVGVVAFADGDVLINNAGTIHASNDTIAYGVVMDAAGISTLKNTGTVRTYAATEGQIAVLGLDGVQSIQNYGQLFGAVVTNGGDDVLDNHSGGVWHLSNHSTDFGDGDDAIHNLAGGTIAMFNAAIYMGGSTDAGNVFNNAGRIKLAGDNLIDMGTGSGDSLVPSLNPLPLVNTGVLDFVDGATDDSLTITGDLGGNGAVNLDVDFVDHSSDQLIVDGSMASGAVQTVNVAFTGLPPQDGLRIPFATVTGNSTAGSFVGGQLIGFDPNRSFLDLQVGVSSQIDASNATPDVFSVGVDVNGLSDAGSLAASIASGATSLVNSQIGTYRQRMGVMPELSAGMTGVSPWVRAFSDNGDVNPSHVANNFGQGGNFGYSLSSHGWELGMDVKVNSPLHVGVLFNRAEGTQHLHGPGVGTDRLTARTFGLYGTWLAPAFYVDASYRWIGFDAELRSSAGTQDLRDGKARSLNVEAGWNAWNVAGLQVTPQLQYTRTEVETGSTLRGDYGDFAIRGGTSERGRLGVGLSKTIHGGSWTWTPYGSLNAVREFDGQMDFAVADRFFGSTSTEGTSTLAELGLGAQRGGFSATGGVNWTDGGALDGFFGGQVVLRYTW